LRSCSYVFRRVDTVKKPLEPPYTGPQQVLRRINNKTFVIKIGGREKTVSTDSLKSAYLERDEAVPAEMAPQQDAAPARPTTPKRVSFPSLPEKVSGGGVDVGRQSTCAAPGVATNQPGAFQA